MRLTLLSALALAATLPAITPASAQDVDNRVDRLEREVRALQRRVFPGGSEEFFEPDITPGQTQTTTGSPASAPLTDLTDRVNALERQLQALTGQVEENSFNLRQLQSEVSALRDAQTATPLAQDNGEPDIPSASDITGDSGSDSSSSSTQTASADSSTPSSSGASSTSSEEPLPEDPGEASYVRGYRLWRDGNYEAAQSQLRQTIDDYPGHSFESYARNLLGRAYLDDGKPANATEIFVRNYQELPNGPRAADSLFFLGVALTELDYKSRACLAFDELQDVYGEGLRSTIAEQVPAAREAAECN